MGDGGGGACREGINSSSHLREVGNDRGGFSLWSGGKEGQAVGIQSQSHSSRRGRGCDCCLLPSGLHHPIIPPTCKPNKTL